MRKKNSLASVLNAVDELLCSIRCAHELGDLSALETMYGEYLEIRQRAEADAICVGSIHQHASKQIGVHLNLDGDNPTTFAYLLSRFPIAASHMHKCFFGNPINSKIYLQAKLSNGLTDSDFRRTMKVFVEAIRTIKDPEFFTWSTSALVEYTDNFGPNQPAALALVTAEMLNALSHLSIPTGDPLDRIITLMSDLIKRCPVDLYSSNGVIEAQVIDRLMREPSLKTIGEQAFHYLVLDYQSPSVFVHLHKDHGLAYSRERLASEASRNQNGIAFVSKMGAVALMKLHLGDVDGYEVLFSDKTSRQPILANVVQVGLSGKASLESLKGFVEAVIKNIDRFEPSCQKDILDYIRDHEHGYALIKHAQSLRSTSRKMLEIEMNI